MVCRHGTYLRRSGISGERVQQLSDKDVLSRYDVWRLLLLIMSFFAIKYSCTSLTKEIRLEKYKNEKMKDIQNDGSGRIYQLHT